MQQAALTDIFSNLDRASPTSTKVLRAQTQTLAVQSKWYLGFPPGREQQAVLTRRHRFCTECCCPREPLCPPELCSPAGHSPLPRAAGKGWEHCRGASYSPCTVSLQTSGQCPRTQTCLSVCPASRSWLWALQGPHSFFCLGLCIWLLVSINNWRYWFLGIQFCSRKFCHALVFSVFSKSTTSLPSEKLQATVFVRNSHFNSRINLNTWDS